jgi:hypothetical protein
VWDQALAPVAARPTPMPPVPTPGAVAAALLPVGPLDVRPSTRGQLPTVWGGNGAKIDLLVANTGTAEALVQLDLYRGDGSRVRVPRRLALVEELTMPLYGDVGGEDVAVAFTSDVPVRVMASSRAADGALSVVQPSDAALRWVFPDAQSGAGVATTFALFNPGTTPISGRAIGRGDAGAMLWEQPFRLEPGERQLVDSPRTAGHQAFWTSVVADGPISVARRTKFVAAVQANGGNALPAERWLMPRAVLGHPWISYLVIVNPGDRPADVRVRMVADGRTAAEQRIDVPALGRVSIEASTPVRDVVAQAEIIATVPVVVERSAYDTTGVATVSDIGQPQGVGG